jgi:NAD+ diphosphatase
MPNSELSLPELPWVANDESMLTRKFGKEVVNYYAGGSLNRYSFLRPDTGFLRSATLSPSSRWLALNNLNPLITSESQLAYLTFDEVRPLIGADPFSLSEEESIKQFNSTKANPLIVFLGILEGPQSDIIDSTSHGPVKGEPYFAVDATPSGTLAEAATAFLKEQENRGRKIQSNPRNLSLNAEAGEETAPVLWRSSKFLLTQIPCSCRLCPGPVHGGLELTQWLLRRLRQSEPLGPRRL